MPSKHNKSFLPEQAENDDRTPGQKHRQEADKRNGKGRYRKRPQDMSDADRAAARAKRHNYIGSRKGA